MRIEPAIKAPRREADIALRLQRPREPNLITRQLADIPLSLYGSPSYLEARGVPVDPDASLHGHDVLLFAAMPAFRIENDWMAPT